MKKKDEIELSASCLNRAKEDDFIFVLIERDLAMPATIKFWCEERIRVGKNTWEDAQIKEAWSLAESIELAQYLKLNKG